jgi:hypothetical protein
VLPLLLTLAIAPWAHPLEFTPSAGWQEGASGTTGSAYVGQAQPAPTALESAAWTAQNVRYRDRATADPPNKTLAHLPPNGLIVWAVIFAPVQNGKSVRLDFAHAQRFACCEATYVAGGEYELTGTGPGRAYSVIVRIYFGSRPTRGLKAEAQLALGRLRLPSPR